MRATLLALGAAIVLSGCGSDAPTRLNVLLITVDTLRADHLSGYGYPRATSPNLDRFFDSAVTFDDAQANSGWTLPSLASIMTSLPPSAHRCVKFDSRLDASHQTLAEILGAAGYQTHGVGSHTFLREKRGLQQGFDTYDDDLILEAERTARHVSSGRITDKAIQWLDARAAEAGSQPWLLWLHYFDPHTVYVEHPGIADAFGRARPVDLYDGEVAFTDRELGRLFRQLSRMGGDAETIVVFAADHGESFGDRGSSAHSTHLFAEVTRIPFAIRDPRYAPRRVAGAVESLDLVPTLLELLAIETEAPLHGASLVAAMRGEAPAERPILAETEMSTYNVVDSLTLGRWKLVADRSGGLERANAGRVAVRPRGRARGEPAYYLFDREADPLERVDVSPSHPALALRLRAALDTMLQAASARGDAFESSEPLRLSPGEIEAVRALGYVEDRPAG